MNKKVRHLGKRKTNSSATKLPRKLHTLEYTNSCLKNKVSLYSNEDTIDYNQQCHPLHIGNEQYMHFPPKRKNLKKEKGRGKAKKRECEQQGKGEGKGEERREREEERVRTRRKGRRKRRRKKRRKKEEKMEKAVLKVLL